MAKATGQGSYEPLELKTQSQNHEKIKEAGASNIINPPTPEEPKPKSETVDETEAFLQQMEVELVNPIRISKLKSWLKKNKKEKLLDELLRSDRFSIVNIDNDKFVVSKKYSDLSELKDYYGILGVVQDATEQEIEVAYNARSSNPLAKEAYETLIDPEKRKAYEEKLERLKELFIKQVNSPGFRMVPLGGGREIGRSCLYVRVGNHYVLLDAGGKLDQSRLEPLYPRLDVLKWLPKVEAVFISHVHADHILALPFIPSDVPIYMSEETLQSLEFLAKDFVHKGTWSWTDEMILSNCIAQDSGSIGDLEFRFYNAGHVPGSKMIFLKSGNDSVLYTGDLNFEETRLEKPAEPIPEKVNALIMEGTYVGEGKRESRKVREAQLIETVAKALKEGKKVLIPAFAVGRTAEVVMALDEAIEKGEIPNVEAYVVGQGAGLMRQLEMEEPIHFEMIGGEEEIEGVYNENSDMVANAYWFKGIMRAKDSAIIVGGSGMGDSGIAAQLISSVLDREDVVIVLVGYQAPSSTGGMLLQGKKTGKIVLPGTNNRMLEVKCDVVNVSLTAHAAEDALLDFIKKQNPDTIFVVHIKPKNVDDFRKVLGKKNAVPYNLQVAFEYAHTGVRLIPYGIDEETSINTVCSCGMKFSSLETARRHADMEGHKLVFEAKWYYFKYDTDGDPEPKDIKGSFYGHLKNKEAVSSVYVYGDTIVAEGKLSDEEIKHVVRTMRRAGKHEISLSFVKAVEIPMGKLNIPLMVADVTKRINELLGAKLDTPVFRVTDLFPGVAGMYESYRGLLLINNKITDQEDANLMLAHEIAHYAQDELNRKLAKDLMDMKENRLWLAGAIQFYFLFSEGFAEYVVEKLGCSKKLITLYHENQEDIPVHYVLGRRFFEYIEALFGEEKALSLGLNAGLRDFVKLYTSGYKSELIKSSPLISKVFSVMKEKKIWKRRFIFFWGIPRKIRKEMIAYMLANVKKVMEEFAGWDPAKVIDDVMMLCYADFFNIKYQFGIPRDTLKIALRFILVKHRDLMRIDKALQLLTEEREEDSDEFEEDEDSDESERLVEIW